MPETSQVKSAKIKCCISACFAVFGLFVFDIYITGVCVCLHILLMYMRILHALPTLYSNFPQKNSICQTCNTFIVTSLSSKDISFDLSTDVEHLLLLMNVDMRYSLISVIFNNANDSPLNYYDFRFNCCF